MYDPLNKVVVDACLAPAKASSVNLALKPLEHTQANDLIIFESKRHLLHFFCFSG
jgi:hypothetical protein